MTAQSLWGGGVEWTMWDSNPTLLMCKTSVLPLTLTAHKAGLYNPARIRYQSRIITVRFDFGKPETTTSQPTHEQAHFSAALSRWGTNPKWRRKESNLLGRVLQTRLSYPGCLRHDAQVISLMLIERF